ncbi:MAG: DUF945 domain-containing protein [Akkermansiaceae bacterium]|nr:DUF945 domain-containing protein [Akkermansiaceae bacterium]
MTTNPPRRNWFFPIEEAPVHATVTHNGVTRNVRLPHRKALVAVDTGEIVGIVGQGYKLFTNDQAVGLCHKFCLEAFPDTRAAEWHFVDGHGPATRSWAAMDIHHQSHAMNLMGNGGPSEVFTPFVRITNSYNGTRALRIDVGFLREHCSNGVIFEQEAATLTVPHTRQGIHSLKVARPFDGMANLRDNFRNTLAGIRGVAIGLDDAKSLVRTVTGWPELPESPKDWEKADQAALDTDLDSRLQGYFNELGANAYAAFNTLTDIAARPPHSPRFRRDRPTLERRSGAWLRDFHTASTRPGFSISGHLVELAGRQ